MITIERLRVRCRTADEQAAGSLTHRLAAIAQRLLPDALDARLGSSAGAVGQLQVRFDFDPREYDDSTVAVLWADRIAGAFERTALPGDRPPHEGAAGDPIAVGGEPLATSPETPGRPEHELRSTPAGDAARPDASPQLPGRMNGAQPPAALVDGEARRSWLQRVASMGDLVLWDELLEVAEEVLGLPLSVLDPSSAARLISEHDSAWQAVRAATAALPSAEVPRTASDRREVVPPPRSADRAVMEEARDAFAGAAPSRSRVGGIVLFYPWLRTALETAAQRFSLDPAAARLAALVELSGEGRATGDPLLRVLAGAEPDLSVPEVDPSGREWLQEWAANLYGRLAETLPGFETSSRSYLLLELIERQGVVVATDVAVEIILAPRPLDLVLARYPYPRSSFRLPWTPPIRLTWETH